MAQSDVPLSPVREGIRALATASREHTNVLRAVIDRQEEIGASIRGTHSAVVEWGRDLQERQDATAASVNALASAVRELSMNVRSLGEFVHGYAERVAEALRRLNAVDADIGRLTREIASLGAHDVGE